ncbi:MAG TPA: CHAT domain-containing protein, partial [Archangium sp.]|uniref:CHAT domain-containing protein n=1 Tax=Archangium sp. TaxID=1872627 RepID=UPI002ED865BF
MRSADLIVDIRPGKHDPKDLVLVVGGKGIPLRLRRRRKLARQLHRLELKDADLINLRSGTAPEEVCAPITKAVTEWLLSSDFSPIVVSACRHLLQKKRRLRIVLRPHLLLGEQTTERLADIPFELVELAERIDSRPLVLHPSVQGLVHACPEEHPSERPLGVRDWPLRVLIVRSNPKNKGGNVPEARELRERVEELAKRRYGEECISVTLFSSEPPIGRPALWEDVQKDIKKRSAFDQFHVLVFIGHGDIKPGHPAAGRLWFEQRGRDGLEARSVDALQLRTLLDSHPIPVVLLVGCLTGAPQEKPADEPRATRILARALVDSHAGVQLAVGMRYRFSARDVAPFLEGVFDSLLRQTPGNVEAAVGAGRSLLYQQERYPPSWSAPVIFRALGPEPLLEFLDEASDALQARVLEDERVKGSEAVRARRWEELRVTPVSRDPVGSRDELLDQLEVDFLKHLRKLGLVALMPGVATPRAGQPARVPIWLSEPIHVNALEGELVLDAGAVVSRCQPSSALLDAGFKLKTWPAGPGRVAFRIERPLLRKRGAPLPVGPLFEVE